MSSPMSWTSPTGDVGRVPPPNATGWPVRPAKTATRNSPSRSWPRQADPVGVAVDLLFVRHDAEVGAELTELGEELRNAEQAGDAPRCAAGNRRRRLVDTLVAQAFEWSEQDPPAATSREEVVATLNATLADPMWPAEIPPARWSGRCGGRLRIGAADPGRCRLM